MKKFMTDIKTMAALLIAGAAFTACSSSDDNIIDEQPVNPAQKTYTLTVNASKGDGATTRALDLTGKTLTASWATAEKVYVKKGETWATGSLQPQEAGTSTTLKGTLSGIDIVANDELTLQFPRSGAISYAGQVGTLADIAEKYDYATASVTVASISASGNINPEDATTTFTNQQAIIKFTLKDKANDAAISPSALTVTDGTSTVSLTSIPGTTYTANEASNVLYVAFPAAGSAKTVTLTATVGDDTYTYEKSGVTFTNGQYYEITVKMTKQAPAQNIVDLSTLTAAYEAQDGDVLTGELQDDYQITIAADATVTLRDATITCLSEDAGFAGITPVGDATILLEGTNVVKGGFTYGYSDYPGIFAPAGYTLTIDGTGSLTASKGDNYGSGCGIGGGYFLDAGNIVINGGNITAIGGICAAGIGSSNSASCGDITITGGTVNATGGEGAAGIGSGQGGSCVSITIADTVTQVTATKGENSPNSIGAGLNATSCGTVTIDGVVNATTSSTFEHFNSTVSDNTWTLTHK